MATQDPAPPLEGAAGDTETSATPHRQLDAAELQSLMPWININMAELVAQMEKDDTIICRQMKRGYNPQMRSELRRLKSFEGIDPFISWSPEEMAGAGFYYTGLKTSVQCFCCGGIFCNFGITKMPRSEHQRFEPDCGFLKMLDVGDIPKYAVRVHPPGKVPLDRRQQLTEEGCRLESFKGWPFYVQTEPSLLAGAGFFYTGVKDQVQCFSCDGSLANWEEGDDPWQEHAKWFPQCEYLQGQKSKEERDQYRRSYVGFHGVTAADFLSEDLCPSPSPRGEGPESQPDPDRGWNIFAAEKTRLESFHNWPPGCSASPAELAGAGFFYQGRGDCVQCFCCGVQLLEWEEEDNAWTEHRRHSSECPYLLARDKAAGGDAGGEQPRESSLSMPDEGAREKDDPIAGESLPSKDDWAETVRRMRKRLQELYRSPEFHTDSFNDCIPVELGTCYAEPRLVLKDLKDREVRQLAFPEMLRDLRRVTLLEGEAGMGKSALLRRVAILWASGRCPLLARFVLVLHVSVTQGGWGWEAGTVWREPSLGELVSRLGGRLLVLLDGYGEAEPLPAEDELVRANHRGNAAVLVGLRTDKAAAVRQFADAVVSIAEFPLYSSIRLLKMKFAHDAPRLRKLIYDAAWSKTLRAALKTPLFTLALCQHWVREPLDIGLSCVSLFRAFLAYAVRPKSRGERARRALEACGSLALSGFLVSRYKFSDEDLLQAGVDADGALGLGLLSKFTAQRLTPTFRFPHVSFQEYLAGKRLGGLLGSELAAEREEGSSSLGQVRTFLEVFTRYYYLLVYAASWSSKAASLIVTHLLDMTQRPTSFDYWADASPALVHHPDLMSYRDLFIQGSQIMDPEEMLHLTTSLVLDFVLSLTNAETRSSIASVVLNFLTGKHLQFDVTELHQRKILTFLKVYPETLTVLSHLKISLTGKKRLATMSYSKMVECMSNLSIPKVEEDYVTAFQSLEQIFLTNQAKEEEISSFFALSSHNIPDSFMENLASIPTRYKVPVLKLHIRCVDTFRKEDSECLLRLCSLSDCVELTIWDSLGVLGQMEAAVSSCGKRLRALTLHRTTLSHREQELVTAMNALESLDLTFADNQAPEYLLSQLDKLEQLKELMINVGAHSSLKIIDQICDGFAKLQNVEKLTLSGVNCVQDSSKLAHLLRNFPQLRVFRLKSISSFPEFEDLSKALTSCSRLEELALSDFHLSPTETLAFAASLSELRNLRTLEAPSISFSNTEDSKVFARAVGSLVLLEKFHLCNSEGTITAALPLTQQLQNLEQLRELIINKIMDDQSLLELAKAARNGHLRKLNVLDLSLNEELSDLGWRDFFLTLDNVSELRELNISRLYTNQLKPQPDTFKAFVQCVSRLPALVTIRMLSWMLDAMDFNMFSSMKENHPQSRRMRLCWQWALPFSPIIQADE
ncbi:baculoviral IAP repeat-containing protein 1-like [Stegostoma tigrinum]|uniref:baculoviral IAP repeat-containing protein 1-like n=1 Tax=Stegostoma tigrinum TaxID=3053191 RepID=UPI00286FF92E|nr:baculoviral IAP repeat-containing protein 1-like [Stegostoma tigrinum]